MFLAKREREQSAGAAALTGPVTVAGAPAAAYLEGERRDVAIYAPGGYHWVPGWGDEVLVLKAGESGEKPCALGVPTAPAGLRPGEVLIHGGTCSLKLGLNGTVEVTGMLTVNGKTVATVDETEGGQSIC